MGSQISLIPLVDDHQCGYITEFGKKKGPKKKEQKNQPEIAKSYSSETH
jgi:hypothetical protein